MKNLSKTVDRILKIEPALEVQLLPIKMKWEKTHRNEYYWKQLLSILNTEIPPIHPKRSLIQNIFISRKKVQKKLYTFESPSPLEIVIGVIPEYLESRIRHQDRLQVEYAKISLEAKLTHNRPLMVEIIKKTEKLEIAQKKIWMEIKDYFKLWDIEIATSYFIRSQGTILTLTSIALGGSRGPGFDSPEGYFIKMDGDMLKKFYRMMNITPPPGLTPPPESE